MKTKLVSLSIVLTSFLVLFLELTLLRIIPAYIIHINFYTNFILIACFLGIGVGFLLNKKKRDYYPFHLFLLFTFLVLLTATSLKPNIASPENPLLQNNYGYYDLPQGLIISAIFLFVTFLFIPFGQRLGRLFADHTNPLVAYSYDLLGSAMGIATFFLCSLISAPPFVWFTVFSIIFLLTLFIKERRFNSTQFFLSLLLLVYIFFVTRNSIWSPYYKIDVVARDTKFIQDSQSDTIFVNGIWHQNLVKPENNKEDIYFSPYKFVYKTNYDEVLIIGSGGGNDIAVALEHGVKHIDAVEIDPKIVFLGKNLHPSNPYADPRVDVYINDGRNYLNETNKKYDMIIFALTDSLTLVSGQSAIRLESYLFTKESLELAKNRLQKDGIVVFYNYYKKDWILNKLGYSLESAFGRPPYVVVNENNRTLASFIISNDNVNLYANAPPTHYSKLNISTANDDWPFFYLEKHSIPSYYVIAFLTIFLFSILLLRLTFKNIRNEIQSFHLPLFFTGAAFMLLETSAIAKFALLFGSTWVTNCLVFFGILCTALCSNLIASRIKKRLNKNVYFFLLFTSLLFYFIFPFTWLLGTNIYIRYIIGIGITVGPIFFAGLTFSSIFSETKKPRSALGSNLLGTMLGGMLEYVALITGYKFLILVSFALYVTGIIIYYHTTNRQK